jgi:hypothetical protein
VEEQLDRCKDVWTFSGERRAKLVVEAGELEEQGQTALAIQKHRRSMRVFPTIEEWHEVTLGGS